jgi:hypothetical protein
VRSCLSLAKRENAKIVIARLDRFSRRVYVIDIRNLLNLPNLLILLLYRLL